MAVAIHIMTDETPIPDAHKPPAGPSPIPAATTPPSAPALGGVGHNIQNDIAALLKHVKLPERRGPQQDEVLAPGERPLTPPTAPLIINKDTAVSAIPSSEGSAIHAVHTFKDDVQNIVRDKKISLVRAASMEQDRHSHQEESTQNDGATQRQKRTAAVLFATALLVVLGVAALSGVFIIMSTTSGTARTQNDSSLVFAEQNAALSITGTTPSSLKTTIAQARQSSTGSIGSITHVIPTVTTNSADGTPITTAATTAEFFNSLGVHAPDELLTALNDQFFFGVHTVDTNAPFFVIPVVSYSHAFAGMLAWEGDIDRDLSPIFPAVSDTVVDANGVPSRRLFQDGIMRNFDVRTLKNDNGETVLYYSFPSPSILIIAQSPYTFTEVLSRLQSARKL